MNRMPQPDIFWRPFDFYLLRAPRLPFSVIEDLNAKSGEDEVDRFLYDVFKGPEMQDAIFLVSEVLYKELIKWLNDPTSPPSPKLRLTLYKYILRMAGRSTPYGLFAGVSMGEVTESSSSIVLSGDFNPSTRLDMQLSMYLAKLLQQEAGLKSLLIYGLNSSFLEKHHHYYYYEHREKAGKRSYHWVRMDRNPLLEQLIANLDTPKTYLSLVNILIGMGLPEQSALSFIDLLIDNQLLEQKFAASVTGEEIFDKLYHLSQQTGYKGSLADLFRDIRYVLQVDLAVSGATYSGKREIKTLLGGPSIANYFQTDLRICTKENQLRKPVIQTIVDEITELMPLSRYEVPENLDRFRQRFLMRYSDREIPLLEALDPELGIGYGLGPGQYMDEQSLLKDLKLHRSNVSKDKNTKALGDLVYTSYINSGSSFIPVELTEKDIQELKDRMLDRKDPLPPSFYMMGQLLSNNMEMLDQGSFQFFLSACGGCSALPLMGRFAYLDNNLVKKLKNCAQWEDEYFSEAIVAEIVHLPDDRVGNILKRPVLRSYEIPVLGIAAVDTEFQIPLSDILVSVKDGRVLLRSRRLNKWIIPRLSSAHNYHSGIAPYRFLCDVQSQSGQINIDWNWGDISNQSFLPRVTYKHLILSRARWKIPSEFVQANHKLGPSDKIDLLREKFQFPAKVILADGDNELFLDLHTKLACDILLDRLRKGDAYLYEFIFENLSSPVQGPDGFFYLNELIIPVKNEKKISLAMPVPLVNNGIKRIFPPGSEWVYLKIYSGEKQCDVILEEIITPFVRRLSDQRLIDKWFFIRYHDPEPHLRIRFLQVENDVSGSQEYLIKQIYHALQESIECGEIVKIQFDTYEREIERYAGDCIEESESVFCIDSRCVLALLPVFKEPESLHFRWLCAVKGVDQLLDVFGISLSAKAVIMKDWHQSFLEEFAADKQTKYMLDLKYREYRHLVESYLQEMDPTNLLGQSILQLRMEALQAPVEKLLDKLHRYYPENHRIILEPMLSSLCHMFINRIFFSSQRENELVIYHLLSNFYVSSVKRKNKSAMSLALRTAG